MAILSGTNPTYPGLAVSTTLSGDTAGTLGTAVESTDGRAFRLVRAGAVPLVAGNLISGPATVANHTNLATAGAAIAQGTNAQTIIVTLGATAATAQQYAGGTLIVNAGTGMGQTLTINSNPAANASAALALTLDEKLAVALDATSKLSLVANVYNGVVVHPTASTCAPLGVVMTPVPAGFYAFVQTRGPASVLSDVTIAGAGLGVMPSTTTAGAVTVGTATGTRVGIAIVAGVSAESRPVFLALE
jgi:hypothetical protein